MNPYYQLIPVKVLQDLKTIEDMIKHEIKSFDSDYMKEIISIVACHTPKDESNENTGAQLQMSYLKKLVPSGDEYLRALLKIGVVKRLGGYIVGKGSFKYCFATEYQSKYKSLPLNNQKLKRRIKAGNLIQKKQVKKSIRGTSEQSKYLNMLTIDPGYKALVESIPVDEIERFNSITASATRIKNNDIFYSRDDTSKRFHSNISNMFKGLREYLRIKGKPLVNLDLKNSQPYLSIILLTNPEKVVFLINNPVFAMNLKTLKVQQSQDVKKYISLAISGEIYEYLMSEIMKEGLILDRSTTKREFIKILFDKNVMPVDAISRKCKQVFKKCFPVVFQTFCKIRGNETGNHFQSYKRFAILLQSIESYLILDIILKRVYNELPGVPAMTIHDSILTTSENIDPVKKIMIDELSSFIGFLPSINVEGNEKQTEIIPKQMRSKSINIGSKTHSELISLTY